MKHSVGHKLVLLIDDSPLLCAEMTSRLQMLDYQVKIHTDMATLEECISKHPFALILVELLLMEANAFQLVRSIRSYTKLPIILMTATERLTDAGWGEKCGATVCLKRPVQQSRLQTCLHQALNDYPLTSENK